MEGRGCLFPCKGSAFSFWQRNSKDFKEQAGRRASRVHDNRHKVIDNVRTKNDSKQLSEVTDLVQLNFHRKNGTALLELIDLYLGLREEAEEAGDEAGGDGNRVAFYACLGII